MTKILTISGDLETHPYKRTLGVLQMVVNVATCRGFADGGAAVVTAQKLRLLHAGVRGIVRRRLPDYEATYGVPVNQEDMLGTIMGFSYLVIEGLRQLEIGLSAAEEDDLYYLWSIFAHTMGIDPNAIPSTVEDARTFYAAYARRHYVDAADNPDGVRLAAADLSMLQHVMPTVLRWLGLNMVPRLYMQELMGRSHCQQIGIQPVRGHAILKWALSRLPVLWLKLWGEIDDHNAYLHETESRLLFQGLIDQSYGGKVEFLIPETVKELHKLA